MDKRTKAGKAEWDAFVELAGDATVLSRDEMRRLALMRDSVWAHPMAARVLNAEGYVQASYYWTDAETGVRCKIRPDKLVPVSVGGVAFNIPPAAIRSITR